MTVPTQPDGTRRRAAGRARRVGRVAFVLALVLVLAAAGGLGWLQIRGSGSPSSTARSIGQDAEWLGHAWVDGRRTAADVTALAGRLRGSGVRDLFVHAGPLGDDGRLDPALHPRARWLVDAVHAAAPGTRVQAWLGNVVRPGRMDLSDRTTRAQVLGSARQVLDLGFDGVHYTGAA